MNFRGAGGPIRGRRAQPVAGKIGQSGEDPDDAPQPRRQMPPSDQHGGGNYVDNSYPYGVAPAAPGPARDPSSGDFSQQRSRNVYTPEHGQRGAAAAADFPGGGPGIEPKFGRRARTVDPTEQRARDMKEQQQQQYQQELKRQMEEEAERKRRIKEQQKREDEKLERRAVEERRLLGLKEQEEQRMENDAKSRAEAAAMMGGRRAAAAAPAAAPPAAAGAKRNPNETAPSVGDGIVKMGKKSDVSDPTVQSNQSKEQQFRDELRQQAEEAKRRKDEAAAAEKAKNRQFEAWLDKWADSDKPLGTEGGAPVAQQQQQQAPPQGGGPGLGRVPSDSNVRRSTDSDFRAGAVDPYAAGRGVQPPAGVPPLQFGGGGNPAGVSPRDYSGVGYPTQSLTPRYDAMGLPPHHTAAAYPPAFSQLPGAPPPQPYAPSYATGPGGIPMAYVPIVQPALGYGAVVPPNPDVSLLRQEIMSLLSEQRRDMEELRQRGAALPGAAAIVAPGIQIPNSQLAAPPPAHRGYPAQGAYNDLGKAPPGSRYGETQQLLDRFLKEDEARRDDGLTQFYSAAAANGGGRPVAGLLQMSPRMDSEGHMELGGAGGGGYGASGAEDNGSSNVDLCHGGASHFVGGAHPRAGRRAL